MRRELKDALRDSSGIRAAHALQEARVDTLGLVVGRFVLKSGWSLFIYLFLSLFLWWKGATAVQLEQI